MLSAARLRHGAKVVCGARVVDLIMAGDRVTGVRIADGTQYEADTVVNCAGRWTNEATRNAGLHLPLAPTVGFLVFTPPVAASLSRVVRTPVIQARPDGAGRLMLHWNPTDATLSIDTRLSPSTPEARDLVRRARQLLPSIGEVEPEAVRIAIRPIPGDQLSAIGPMPRTSGYYIAITHSGVTMSPFLGAVVADEIVRGRQPVARRSAALRRVGLKLRMPSRAKVDFIRFTMRLRSPTRQSRSRFGRLASSSAIVGTRAMLQWPRSPRSHPKNPRASLGPPAAGSGG
jgi:glycine/D-amino acid oxidase-like deaminating enzyme